MAYFYNFVNVFYSYQLVISTILLNGFAILLNGFEMPQFGTTISIFSEMVLLNGK